MARAARTQPLDVDLEDTILRDPEAISPRRVYADWLLEANDPRGELASVQLSLEEAESPDERLVARHRELIMRHGKRWAALPWREWSKLSCGRYEGPSYLAQSWRGGFLDVLQFSGYGDRLREIATNPSCRLTREIDVDVFYGPSFEALAFDDAHRYDDAIDALRENATGLRALRTVGVGVRDPGGSHDESVMFNATLSNTERLATAFPELEKLAIRMMGAFAFGAFQRLRVLDLGLAGHTASIRAALSSPLDALRTLVIAAYSLAADPSLVQAIATAAAPELDRVELTFGPPQEQQLEELRRAVLAARPSITVTTSRLQVTDMWDDEDGEEHEDDEDDE